MRIIDDKTNEKIDKVLAILSEDTTLREALIVTFACAAAVCETVLDQVEHKEQTRTAIIEYADMLVHHLVFYEPKPK